MSDLPTIALSVRQPWAWAIVQGLKPIENRSAKSVSFMVPLEGARAIHAAKGMTREKYESAADFMAGLGIAVPPPAELLRGGIVGVVEVTGVVSRSESPWFFGPRGLVLENARPCAFIPVVGQLGYFAWTPADASIVPPPARWMLPDAARSPGRDKTRRRGEPDPDLFGGGP